MPAARPSITPTDVATYVRERAFSCSGDAIGVEAEWFPYLRADPGAHVPFDAFRAAVDAAGPLASAVSYEPGGQLELSTPASSDIGTVCRAIDADVAAVRRSLDRAGFAIDASGVDPVRAHRRTLGTPRYAAMQRYFDAGGPAGRRMMCRTAAVQVNVDAGQPIELRWRTAHAIGPVLVAAFASSPFCDGRRMPWRSTRMATWWAMDRTRTAPVPHEADPIDAWTSYVLEANVMMVRVGDDRFEPVMSTLPFERWIADGSNLGYPTLDDLEYHLTTLFPPIRPRGWLELRMIDAQRDPWWRVAAAVPVALVYAADPGVALDTSSLWLEAFTDALEHPALARAATRCFDAALEALPDVGADSATIDATCEYVARYVRLGRCPADDLIDAYEAGGAIPAFGSMPIPTRS